MPGGSVTIHQYGGVAAAPTAHDDKDDTTASSSSSSTGAKIDPLAWPSGELFQDMLLKENVKFLSEAQRDPVYWQVSARWALLKKYGLLLSDDDDDDDDDAAPTSSCEPTKKEHHDSSADESNDEKKRELVFTKEQRDAIQKRWKEVVVSSAAGAGATTSGEDAGDNEKAAAAGRAKDLLEFVTTGKSNARQLQWSTMDCQPGCQFNLHAHPNLELVYCAKGSLHEVRMKGEPLTRDYDKVTGNKLKGPDLTSLRRPWYFATLRQGEWLVNEVGSVHKSFTASKDGGGCLLVVLWGGSHADVVPGEEPLAPDVSQTVNEMDAKLGRCDCTNWETIEETFLPESERSGGSSCTNDPPSKRKLEETTEERDGGENPSGGQEKKAMVGND